MHLNLVTISLPQIAVYVGCHSYKNPMVTTSPKPRMNTQKQREENPNIALKRGNKRGKNDERTTKTVRKHLAKWQ